MRSFAGESANAVWTEAVSALLADEEAISVDSRNGRTREFLHTILTIRDPRDRWVVGRLPPMNPAFALAEVIWILAGRDDIGLLTHWFPRYPHFVGNEPHQHGAYGKRLRHHFGCDQIRRAIDVLRNDPNSRQVVLQIWSCSDDLPAEDGKPRSQDIPCNIASCLKVRDDQLEWLQIIRSNDVDRGVPHNIVQFTVLQELMAGWLGLKLGEYVQVSDSFHWYEKQSARLKVDTSVQPAANTDRFGESMELSLGAFEILAERMDQIVEARASGDAPPPFPTDLSPPFEHMFMLVAADDARRHGDRAGCITMVRRCANPALRQMWGRWLNHVGYPGDEPVASIRS